MKLPSQMTRAQLEKRAEKLRTLRSELNQRAIAMGRGHWRFTDTEKAAKAGDEFSIKEIDISDELRAVLFELDRIKDGYRPATPRKENPMKRNRKDWSKADWRKYFASISKGKKAKATRKKSRAKNPARSVLYKITAQGTGKKMHFDGEKFSERSRVKTFTTVEAANAKALELVRKYPVLRKYAIRIESNF